MESGPTPQGNLPTGEGGRGREREREGEGGEGERGRGRGGGGGGGGRKGRRKRRSDYKARDAVTSSLAVLLHSLPQATEAGSSQQF